MKQLILVFVTLFATAQAFALKAFIRENSNGDRELRVFDPEVQAMLESRRGQSGYPKIAEQFGDGSRAIYYWELAELLGDNPDLQDMQLKHKILQPWLNPPNNQGRNKVRRAVRETPATLKDDPACTSIPQRHPAYFRKCLDLKLKKDGFSVGDREFATVKVDNEFKDNSTYQKYLNTLAVKFNAKNGSSASANNTASVTASAAPSHVSNPTRPGCFFVKPWEEEKTNYVQMYSQGGGTRPPTAGELFALLADHERQRKSGEPLLLETLNGQQSLVYAPAVNESGVTGLEYFNITNGASSLTDKNFFDRIFGNAKSSSSASAMRKIFDGAEKRLKDLNGFGLNSPIYLMYAAHSPLQDLVNKLNQAGPCGKGNVGQQAQLTGGTSGSNQQGSQATSPGIRRQIEENRNPSWTAPDGHWFNNKVNFEKPRQRVQQSAI